jgi:hypothetical protein
MLTPFHASQIPRKMSATSDFRETIELCKKCMTKERTEEREGKQQKEMREITNSRQSRLVKKPRGIS